MRSPASSDEAPSSSSSGKPSMEEEEDSSSPSSAQTIAKGIASVLGPVMNNFDAGVEGALKSQSVLASSIDRLTRELDKLLEDAPLPYVMQHATKLSGVRKRVVSLNSNLRIIQKRIDSIERLLSGYASKAAFAGKQESISSSHMEGSSRSTSQVTASNPASMEIPLTETLSFISTNDDGKDELCSDNQSTQTVQQSACEDAKAEEAQVCENNYSAIKMNGSIDPPLSE